MCVMQKCVKFYIEGVYYINDYEKSLSITWLALLIYNTNLTKAILKFWKMGIFIFYIYR